MSNLTATPSPLPMPGPDDPIIPISDRAAFLARVHFGVTVPLLVLTLIPFSARVYVRTWPTWRVGWDDWLICLGFLSSIASFLLLTFEMYTTPRLISFLAATNAIKLAYLAVPLWNLSMTLIKTSAAITLIARFHPLSTTTRWWRPLLLSIIVVQILYFIANTVYTFTKCKPLVAAWDYSNVGGVCLTLETDLVVSSTGSAINIGTDILVSLAPMVAVLWRLQRPRRERILICCLTGVGLLASGASVAKAVMVGEWSPDNYDRDSWALAISIGTWTVAEQFIAVFGACSPSLKGPIERLLGRWGIALTKGEQEVGFMRVVGERVKRKSVDVGREDDVVRGEMPVGKGGPVRFGDEWETGDTGGSLSGGDERVEGRRGV